MPRLKNVNTGAIVSVPDEKVGNLGSQWEPADQPKPAAKRATTAKK